MNCYLRIFALSVLSLLSSAAAPTTAPTPTGPTTRPAFAIYDASFGAGKPSVTIAGCKPVFWASPAVVCPWHQYNGKFVYDPTERDFRSIAAKVKAGGYVNIGTPSGSANFLPVPKGALTFRV